MTRSLANALIAHGKIQTTEAKAKSLRVFIEKMITKSKAGGNTSGVAAFRELSRELNQKAVAKLVREIAPRFNERHGGYTRIIKLPPRISDGARMSIIELLTN